MNGVLSAIQSLGGYDASTQTAGPLNGNATLESFQNQLENILGQVKSGNTGGVASLADLGITADANSGQLDSNSGTLTNALSANLTAVGNLLGGKNGIATQLNALINEYSGPGGLLSTINQGLQIELEQCLAATNGAAGRARHLFGHAHLAVQRDGCRRRGAQGDPDLSKRRVQSESVLLELQQFD